MSRTTLLHVVGARPNFMKVAPVHRAASERGIAQVMVHTGQHYDATMSDRFFDDLGLSAPEVNLGVGGGSHAEQTARIMMAFEPVLDRFGPEWVVVYGDVNSTVAAALVSAKKGVRICHVEAGLRSGDRTMPEEVNRVVTDQLSDLCLTPSADGDDNLMAEGIPAHRIVRVGNVMVDTLLRFCGAARALQMAGRMGVTQRHYAVVTLHRPGNVDDPAVLRELLEALDDLGSRMPVLFAVHPRTRLRIDALGWSSAHPGLRLLGPLGYLETIGLAQDAALVLTDSGGLQEETTVLGVPCLTARPNTERPITVSEGTNRLVESSRAAIALAIEETLARSVGGAYEAKRPALWDGHAGERVVEAMISRLPASA